MRPPAAAPRTFSERHSPGTLRDLEDLPKAVQQGRGAVVWEVCAAASTPGTCRFAPWAFAYGPCTSRGLPAPAKRGRALERRTTRSGACAPGLISVQSHLGAIPRPLYPLVLAGLTSRLRTGSRRSAAALRYRDRVRRRTLRILDAMGRVQLGAGPGRSGRSPPCGLVPPGGGQGPAALGDRRACLCVQGGGGVARRV